MLEGIIGKILSILGSGLAWILEHNAEKLQEILNRIMQGIMSIITSALPEMRKWGFCVSLILSSVCVSYYIMCTVTYIKFPLCSCKSFMNKLCLGTKL